MALNAKDKTQLQSVAVLAYRGEEIDLLCNNEQHEKDIRAFIKLNFPDILNNITFKQKEK